MAAPIPSFVVPLCFAAGLLLFAAGIPLYLRRIPPNPLYGIRVRSTMSDERIWYDINARAGRDLMVIAAVYLGLLGLAALYAASWDPALRVLGPLVVLVLGLMIDTTVLMRAARRLDVEDPAAKA